MKISEVKSICLIWDFNKIKYGKDRKPPCKWGTREKIGTESYVVCSLKTLCQSACIDDYLTNKKRRLEVMI